MTPTYWYLCIDLFGKVVLWLLCSGTMVRIIQRRGIRDNAITKLRQQQRIVCCVVVAMALGMVVMALAAAFPRQAAFWEQRVEQDIQSIEKLAEKDIEQWEQESARKVGGVAVPDQRTVSTDDDVRIKAKCPYKKITDLTAMERYPTASKDRHMVTPPADNKDGVTLVCCDTTAGPWNILVHHSWAPLGAQRFLDMVESKYFDTTVPLMRCIQNFLCQFGLNGNPPAMKPFSKSIPDDPNWLPEGKENRENSLGVKRFQKGYMAYAGSGKASRDIQLIVALADNGPLAGGSPWEVPWGELVGTHSYETLERIYTGYGEKGPSQALLWKADALTMVKEKYPEIDYLNSCRIVDRDTGKQ